GPQFALGLDVDLLEDPAVGHVLRGLGQAAQGMLGVVAQFAADQLYQLLERVQAVVQGLAPVPEFLEQRLGLVVVRRGTGLGNDGWLGFHWNVLGYVSLIGAQSAGRMPTN